MNKVNGTINLVCLQHLIRRLLLLLLLLFAIMINSCSASKSFTNSRMLQDLSINYLVGKVELRFGLSEEELDKKGLNPIPGRPTDFVVAKDGSVLQTVKHGNEVAIVCWRTEAEYNIKRDKVYIRVSEKNEVQPMVVLSFAELQKVLDSYEYKILDLFSSGDSKVYKIVLPSLDLLTSTIYVIDDSENEDAEIYFSLDAALRWNDYMWEVVYDLQF